MGPRCYWIGTALWLSISLGAIACDDERGVQEAAPRADSYFAGDSEAAPDAGLYAATPASDVITVEFGLVDAGTVSKRYLFLRNTGLADLKLLSVDFQADISADFFVSCLRSGVFVPECPITTAEGFEAPPGSDLVFEISYAPVDLGPDEGSFVLISNAVDHRALTVALSGRGVSAEIELCGSDCTGDQTGVDCSGAAEVCNDAIAPDALTFLFGDADMSTSIRRQLIIRNLGDQDLQIANLELASGASTQFAIDTNGHALPGVIAAGAEVLLWLVFAPTMGGVHEAMLAVRSNDVDEEVVQVVLQGRGMAPRLCPDPLSLNFGNVPTADTKTLSFQISNCGLLDLTVDQIAMNPDPADPEFSLSNLPGFPLVLGVGKAEDISVQYHPSDRGSDSAGVDLFSNDPASELSTGLTGTVVLNGESTPRECDLQAIPFAVNFGGVVQNNAESTELLISNQGTDTCLLSKVEITANSADGEFAILGVAPANLSLQPGDTAVVALEYYPVNLGPDAGVLTLFANDKDGDQVPVDLNGEGVETAVCDVEIQPEKLLNFGLVEFGKTKIMAVEISNRGSAACTLASAKLEIAPIMGDYFEITDAPSYPLTLNKRGQAGSSTRIELTFTPTEHIFNDIAKTYYDTMTILVDDPDLVCAMDEIPVPGKACLSVAGMSKESNIEIVPGSLDFGLVTWGCKSPVRCVSAYNLSEYAVAIEEIALQDPADPNFEIVQAPMTPFDLAGGDNFEVCLRYHPQDLSNHRGVLLIKAAGGEEHAVPLIGTGTDLTDQADVFYQPDRVRSDVLFVIDCSGSMGEDQENLATNFDDFISWAVNQDVDFHLGVVSTDVDFRDEWTGDPPRKIFPGVLVNTTDTPKIVTSDTPNFIDAFTTNVRIGDTCSATEAGLEGAWLALTEPLMSDPTANNGFLRRDAKLYIILVSDEEDQSQGPADFYVDYFQSLKGYRNTEMLTISAICADVPPDGKYYFAAQATGGIFEPIAATDWSQTLTNMGIDAFAAIREFALSRQADEGTLVVKVDGVVVAQASAQDGADGWSYYPDTNTLYFGDDVVPGKGAKIEINYTAICL